jgi:DNA topoisomerase VI subunit A
MTEDDREQETIVGAAAVLARLMEASFAEADIITITTLKDIATRTTKQLLRTVIPDHRHNGPVSN